MNLKLEIYLPGKFLYQVEEFEDLVLGIGDLLAKDYGNESPDGEKFDLEDLKSFIIIKEDEIPAPENFQDEDLFLVIPLKDDENE